MQLSLVQLRIRYVMILVAVVAGAVADTHRGAPKLWEPVDRPRLSETSG
jgi:hypothetical protein